MTELISRDEAERIASELDYDDAANLDCEAQGASDNCRAAAAALRALAAENAQLRQVFMTRSARQNFFTDIAVGQADGQRCIEAVNAAEKNSGFVDSQIVIRSIYEGRSLSQSLHPILSPEEIRDLRTLQGAFGWSGFDESDREALALFCLGLTPLQRQRALTLISDELRAAPRSLQHIFPALMAFRIENPEDQS